jgi:hypothetical protein
VGEQENELLDVLILVGPPVQTLDLVQQLKIEQEAKAAEDAND